MEFLHTMLVFKCLLPEGDQMASCKNGILVWFQSITLVKNLDINCDNPTYPLIMILITISVIWDYEKTFTQFCDAIPIPGHSRE